MILKDHAMIKNALYKLRPYADASKPSLTACGGRQHYKSHPVTDSLFVIAVALDTDVISTRPQTNARVAHRIVAGALGLSSKLNNN